MADHVGDENAIVLKHLKYRWEKASEELEKCQKSKSQLENRILELQQALEKSMKFYNTILQREQQLVDEVNDCNRTYKSTSAQRQIWRNRTESS